MYLYLIIQKDDYFSRWYNDQKEEIKLKVKEFIKEGRLELVNGGWIMPDEANTYYKHLIDNMRIGLKYLKEELNTTTKIGWLIDEFGHSATTSHIFSQMGFDKIVLTRVSHQEKEYRIKNHNLEFIYDPFGQGQEIFAHISYGRYIVRKVLIKYPMDKEIKLNEMRLIKIKTKYFQK